jgi:hypothetical protein
VQKDNPSANRDVLEQVARAAITEDQLLRGGMQFKDIMADDNLNTSNGALLSYLTSIEGFANVAVGQLDNLCTDEGVQDQRRKHILEAVESIRQLSGERWPLNATQESSYMDYCAFDAMLFLVSPSALIQFQQSLTRAGIRELAAIPSMCGFLDTSILCIHEPKFAHMWNTTSSDLATTAATHFDLINKGGVDKQLAMPYSQQLVISKTFQFIEALAIKDVDVGRAVMTDRKMLEVNTGIKTVCAVLEADARLTYIACCMLHKCIYDGELKIEDTPGFENIGNYLVPYRSLLIDPSTQATVQYMSSVFEAASKKWWSKTLLLPAFFHLCSKEINNHVNYVTNRVWLAKNPFIKNWDRTPTHIRGCLQVEDASQRWTRQVTDRRFKASWARIVVAGNMALALIIQAGPIAIQTINLATTVVGATAATATAAASYIPAWMAPLLGLAVMAKLKDTNSDLHDQVVNVAVNGAGAAARGAGAVAANMALNTAAYVADETLASAASASTAAALGTAAAAGFLQRSPEDVANIAASNREAVRNGNWLGTKGAVGAAVGSTAGTVYLGLGYAMKGISTITRFMSFRTGRSVFDARNRAAILRGQQP